jgi:hypothetical protein
MQAARKSISKTGGSPTVGLPALTELHNPKINPPTNKFINTFFVISNPSMFFYFVNWGQSFNKVMFQHEG